MALELDGKNVLVTGATGFIGSYVTKRLLREGAHVRALARNVSKADFIASEGAEIVHGDLTDPDSLKRAVQGCQLVFHFAGALPGGITPWSYYRSVNVEGARVLAEAAHDANVERFVHISTVFVYGIDAGPGTDESSPRKFSNDPYGDTKLEAENVVRQISLERGLPGVIVQPSQVYGPGDENWTLTPFKMIQAGRIALARGGAGLIQPIYIDDLVQGIIAAACRGAPGEVYILCGPRPVTIREYCGYFTQMLGRGLPPSVPGWTVLAFAAMAELAARLTHRPPLLTRGVARYMMMRATYSGVKAQRELGFVPNTTLENGMRSVEEWLKEEGYLSNRY